MKKSILKAAISLVMLTQSAHASLGAEGEGKLSYTSFSREQVAAMINHGMLSTDSIMEFSSKEEFQSSAQAQQQIRQADGGLVLFCIGAAFCYMVIKGMGKGGDKGKSIPRGNAQDWL